MVFVNTVHLFSWCSHKTIGMTAICQPNNRLFTRFVTTKFNSSARLCTHYIKPTADIT